MKLRYTRKALEHLSHILAYTAEQHPGSVSDVGQSIRTALGHLVQFPELGRKGRVAGTRELVIPRLPFIAAYRIKDQHIEILAILHGARKWPTEFRK